jgi:hypothetical protein
MRPAGSAEDVARVVAGCSASEGPDRPAAPLGDPWAKSSKNRKFGKHDSG